MIQRVSEKIYIDLNDAMNTILDFIKSEDFTKATQSLNSAERAAYMSGLGMANCIIASRCQKYYEKIYDDHR